MINLTVNRDYHQAITADKPVIMATAAATATATTLPGLAAAKPSPRQSFYMPLNRINNSTLFQKFYENDTNMLGLRLIHSNANKNKPPVPNSMTKIEAPAKKFFTWEVYKSTVKSQLKFALPLFALYGALIAYFGDDESPDKK